MAKLGVEIVGNERDLLRAFKSSERGARQFNREMGRATRGALAGSGAFRAVGRNLAFASAGFLTAATAVSAIRGAFTELAQAQKVAAQTNAVLRSTGGIAGVTAAHVDKLADSLLHLSGVDDEAIKSGENLLLTFTNVRNVVGRGNDIFDQATKAVLDMSVAMGEDLQSSVIRVGKALQDPVKGVTALRRVGVLLTDQQQKQIKTLVSQNRLLDAQKIILGELTTEFAGQAAAVGRTPIGKFNLLRESFKNFSADVVAGTQGGVVPLVDRLQAWLDKDENLIRVQRDVNKVVNTTVLFVQDLAAAIDKIHDVSVKIKVGIEKVPGFDKGLIELARDAFAQPGFLNSLTGGIFERSGRAKGGLQGPTAPVSVPKQFIPPGTQGLVVGPVSGNGGGTGTTAAEREAAARRAAQRRQFFDTLVGRKLDRVQDVNSLRGQIAALNEIAALIKQRLAKTKDVTRIATLEDKLVDIFRTRAGIKAQIAANRQNARAAAAASILERLGFGVDKTSATKTLNDDLKALDILAAALRKQIAKGGNVLALQQQLFAVQQRIVGTRQQQAEDARERRRAARERIAKANAKGAAQIAARQFGVLGLGPTGGERIPTENQLRKTLGTVKGAIKGTLLDTSEARSTLRNVAKVLSGEFGKVTEAVRQAVDGMLDALTPDKTGLEGTLFHKTSPNALLAGLGLTGDEVRALRGRLAGVGAGGTVAGAGIGAFGVPDSQIVVPVSIDGWQIAKVVTKRQQTRQRRNPPQKRGPNAGR